MMISGKYELLSPKQKEDYLEYKVKRLEMEAELHRTLMGMLDTLEAAMALPIAAEICGLVEVGITEPREIMDRLIAENLTLAVGLGHLHMLVCYILHHATQIMDGGEPVDFDVRGYVETYGMGTDLAR